MPDKPIQPDTEPSDDLEAQLDALLQEVEAGGVGVSGHAEAAQPSPPAAEEEPEPSPPEPEPEPQVAEEPGSAVGGDAGDLQRQIDALLDGAGQEDSEPAKSAETSAERAGVSSGAAGDEKGPADQADASSEDGDDVELISRLDELLAAQADDAIEGDFETVSGVLGEPDEAEQTDAADPPAAEQAGGDSDAAAAAEVDETDAEEDEDEPVSSPAAPASKSPQRSGKGRGEGASAADVARELDEQPEHRSRRPGNARRSRRISRPQVADKLYRVCHTINRPMTYLPSDIRQAVGWSGLLMVINAVALIAYGLIFNIL